MKSTANRFAPSDKLIAQVVDQVIVPFLVSLEAEVGPLRPATLHVFCGGAAGPSVLIPSPDGETEPIKGDLRLGFKQLFNPARVKFVVEAIYRDIAPETGWSGFELDGRTNASGEGNAECRSHIIRYNVWDWRNRLVKA